ncbi:MAG: tetratricopeptide repeat protein [Leptolyngbya sp.]|nr:tetratricopeptide repeat protein [Candidatus Melainabacteria bacterium]
MPASRTRPDRADNQGFIELDPTLLAGIALAVVISVALFARNVLFGESGIITKARKLETGDLEVSVRTSGNEYILDDLISLIKNYSLSGKHEEAIRSARQALTVAEQEFGKNDEAIIPVLEVYAHALNAAKRQVEAKNLKERIKAIENNKPYDERSFKKSRK